MAARIVRKLTDRVVAMHLPSHREYSIFDYHVRRLALRVQPNGAKSWVIRGQVGGRAVRLTLGSVRQVNVAQARAAAREALAARLEPKSPESRAPAFEDFARLYYKRKAPDWSAEGRRTFLSRRDRVLLPAFSSTRIGLIRRADVAEWFYSYSRKRPGNANRSLEYLRAMLNSAKAWGYLPETHANPCSGVRRNRLPPRGRFIDKAGLKRLVRVLERRRSDKPGAADALELLLLTGCRCGEILALRWAYVRDDRLLLPSSKTGPKMVPLGDLAQSCLRRLRRMSKSVFVFPSPLRSGKPISDIRATWRRIREEAQLAPDIRIHDLRHSYVSHCLISGETLFTAGALVGHRRMESTARYAHLVDSQLLATAERIAQRIENWMKQ